MSVPRGVSLCGLKNEPLSGRTQQGQTRRHWGSARTKVTINVELVQLSPDALILRPTLEQLVLDGSHQAGTDEVELDDEIRSIHFDRLAVRFVVNVLFSAAKGGGLARCGEVVEIFGSHRGEIDESKKPLSPKMALAYDGNIHTSNFSCHSKDRILPGTEIWPHYTEGDDQRRGPVEDIPVE